MNNWQPIATVPRDGEVILLFKDRKGVKTVYPARWCELLDIDYPWQVLCYHYGDNFLPDDDYLTHWQHLPTPPEEETK